MAEFAAGLGVLSGRGRICSIGAPGSDWRRFSTQPAEQHNVDVVLRSFGGCNTGELDDLLPTLAEDVIHYFLPESFPTIRGAEHLARFWRKYKRTLDPIWRIDRIIGAGDLVVSEWSCPWRPSVTSPWVMSRAPSGTSGATA
jgi:hypothetical protein